MLSFIPTKMHWTYVSPILFLKYIINELLFSRQILTVTEHFQDTEERTYLLIWLA